MKSQIRRDYIQEKYVIIAPRRGQRPHDLAAKGQLNINKSCIFCPEQVGRAGKEILTVKAGSKKQPWLVKVIANKFPAVTSSNKQAYGYQEVVIETPSHLAEIEDLPASQVAEIFKVYAKRTKDISRDKKIEYILIFKNNGGAAGASLRHAHSQIFATQFLPPHLKDKSQRTQAYKLEKGSCVYCDVIDKERRGPRAVWEDKNIIAFCPWAPMHNYEIWLMPKRHVDNISLLRNNEYLSLAQAMKMILNKINQLKLPYNYYFHQVINDKDQHLYLKITPRGSIWAGVEIGSGLIVNPISPEEAAKFYRQK